MQCNESSSQLLQDIQPSTSPSSPLHMAIIDEPKANRYFMLSKDGAREKGVCGDGAPTPKQNHMSSRTPNPQLLKKPPLLPPVDNFQSSSMSMFSASGFVATTGCSGGRLPPSGPELAATKPTGARAWRSSAAIASASCIAPSSSSASPLTSWPASCCCRCCCWLRCRAWDAMKLTSVLSRR